MCVPSGKSPTVPIGYSVIEKLDSLRFEGLKEPPGSLPPYVHSKKSTVFTTQLTGHTEDLTLGSSLVPCTHGRIRSQTPTRVRRVNVRYEPGSSPGL